MRRGSSGSAVRKALHRLLATLGALVTVSTAVASPPSEFSTTFNGQSCQASCHGLPAGSDSIIVNGSQTTDGADMRALMHTVAGDPMSNILGAGGISNTQLNTIRLWLIQARDGIFQVQFGSSTNFGSAAVGTNGSTQTFTITNERGDTAAYTTAISTTGDFQRIGGTCGATLASATTCTVTVRFEPTASGVRNGSVRYAFNNTGTLQSIALTGTGFIPTPSFSRSPRASPSAPASRRSAPTPAS
jgi:hypothetical protein